MRGLGKKSVTDTSYMLDDGAAMIVSDFKQALKKSSIDTTIDTNETAPKDDGDKTDTQDDWKPYQYYLKTFKNFKDPKAQQHILSRMLNMWKRDEVSQQHHQAVRE